MRGADACKEYIPLVSRHPTSISSCEYSDLIAQPVFQLVSTRYCRMVEVGMSARVYFEKLDGDVLFSTSAHGRARSRIGTRIRIHVFLLNCSVLALPSELSRAASGLDSCVNIPQISSRTVQLNQPTLTMLLTESFSELLGYASMCCWLGVMFP